MGIAQQIDSETADQLFTSAKGAIGGDAIPKGDSELRKEAGPIMSPDDPKAILIGLAPPPATPAEPGAGGIRESW
jgi:hypothetical protein